jgi:hypothetical protein
VTMVSCVLAINDVPSNERVVFGFWCSRTGRAKLTLSCHNI